MNRRLTSLLLSLVAATVSAATNQPNILLILGDDAGYADFGFQGGGKNGDYANLTPNLDRFATNGVRFRNAYVSGPICCPSRAGLLTGRYQQRFGFENNLRTNDVGLATNQLTIANHLKPLGYTNYAIGKWHLGTNAQYHPNVRGFDHFLGFTAGGRTYFQCTNCPPDQRLQHNGTLLPDDSEFYTTDNFARAATNYIVQHRANHPASPFFMYLAFNGVHAPLEARPADLAHPDVAILTNDPNRQLNAAMTLALDRAVGTVLNQLTNSGIHTNTLVVFLSDNGGPEDNPERDAPNWSFNGPLREGKTTLYEGGIRVPFVMSWPGVLATNDALKLIDDPVIALDLLPTFIEAAGGEVRPSFRLDGANLLPRLTNPNVAPLQRCLFWRTQLLTGDQSAVRQGDWKFLRNPDGVPELYDLVNDIGETTNLAATHPEEVATFTAAHAEWERGVIEPLWEFGAPVPSTPALTFGASDLGYVVEKTNAGLDYMLYELREPLSMSNNWTLTWSLSSEAVAGYTRNGYIVLSDGSNSANRIYAGVNLGTLELGILENQPLVVTNQNLPGPVAAEYYFRLDYSAASGVLRLRYGTNQPSINYEPVSVSKVLAGSYGPLRFAGYALQGQARTDFSSILTQPNPLSPPTSPSWTRLQMARDFRSGTYDTNGNYLGGTELMWLAPHKGRLFAGIGTWENDTNAPGPHPGPMVLVKDAATSPWRLDRGFGTNYVRVGALRSVTFTTDKDGGALNPPVTVLLAGVSTIWDEANQGTNAHVFVRNDATDTWTLTLAGNVTSGHAAPRAFFEHVDRVTHVHHVFLSLGEVQLVRGSYDTNSGTVLWYGLPELVGTERILSGGDCNGVAYACVGSDGNPNNDIGGVFWREDGPEPQWHFVVEFADHPTEGFEDVRGFSAVRHPKGFDYEVGILALNSHSKIIRLDPIGGDPRNGHLITEELNIRTFLGDQWDDGTPIAENIISAYNNMTELPDPASGQTVRLIGVFIKDHPAGTNTVEYNNTYYLIRRLDATYDWGRIVDPAEPMPDPFLRANRTSCLSPFEGETNRVLYFGGFDAGGPVDWHNTAWIYRAELPDERATVRRDGNTPVVGLDTTFGWQYQLENSSVLTNFAPLGVPLHGSNTVREVWITNGPAAQDFYRWRIHR